METHKTSGPRFEIFSHNLVWLRKHHSLSKREMAKRLGIGLWSLNKIEQGILPQKLTIDVLYAVWDRFHIRPSVLLTQRLEEN